MSWEAVLTAMLPENLLLAGIVALTSIEIAGVRARAALPLAFIAVAVAAAAAAWLSLAGYAGAPFPGQFSVTPEGLLAKAVVLALVLPVLLMSREDFAGGEFHLLILSSLYGVCLLMSADSFLTLFLGLELMSLPVYALVLLAFRRPQSAEAALKYLVLSGAASATFLLGVSFLYGRAARSISARSRRPGLVGSAGDLRRRAGSSPSSWKACDAVPPGRRMRTGGQRPSDRLMAAISARRNCAVVRLTYGAARRPHGPVRFAAVISGTWRRCGSRASAG
jgi:hypothetical protein